MSVNTRFPPIPYKELKGNQKEIYDASYAMCNKMFNDKFVWKDENDALLGPFMPLLYVPTTVSLHFLGLTKAIATIPGLTPYARETAILTAGGYYGSLFEIYSHERVALATTDLSEEQINELKVAKKPSGLKEEGDVAYDVAIGLLQKNKGPMPDELWSRAEKIFGPEGAQALVHYTALYSYVSILLNGCGCGLPAGEKIK